MLGPTSLIFTFFSTGMVSCWVVDGKTRPMSTFSSNAQHNSEVTVMKWNPAGKRLITGDKVKHTDFLKFN